MKTATMRAVLCAAGLGLGLIATAAVDTWDEPLLWVPDVAVGVSFFALAAVAWPSRRAWAILVMVVGASWFLGTVVPECAYWHRGPLVHVLIAFPLVRVRGRAMWGAVLTGYAAALLPWAWGVGWSALGLSVGLAAALVARVRGAAGRRRVERRYALAGGLAFGAAVVSAIVVDWLDPTLDGAVPALIGYDVALLLVAVLLVVGLRVGVRSPVLDLVVDLDDLRDGAVRDQLAYALGDSSLEIGYWDPSARIYLTPAGEALSPSELRVLIPIEREGAPFAALLRAASASDDAFIRDAVRRAAMLTAANAELRARTRARTMDAEASQRRIVVAGDDERRRIASRVHAEVSVPLSQLERNLAAAETPAERAALERARVIASEVSEHIDRTLAGLSPAELGDGLTPAVAALCMRLGSNVTWSGSIARMDPVAERGLFYACAEVVTNALKHAEASTIHVQLDDLAGARISVADDGLGGADERGGGLSGIRDRLGALGGTMVVRSRSTDSGSGSGTTVVLTIPSATIGTEAP